MSAAASSLIAFLFKEPLLRHAFQKWRDEQYPPENYGRAQGVIRAFMRLRTPDKEIVLKGIGKSESLANLLISELYSKCASEDYFVGEDERLYGMANRWMERTGGAYLDEEIPLGPERAWARLITTLDANDRIELQKSLSEEYDNARRDSHQRDSDLQWRMREDAWRDEVPDDVFVDSKDEWESYKDSRPD